MRVGNRDGGDPGKDERENDGGPGQQTANLNR